MKSVFLALVTFGLGLALGWYVVGSASHSSGADSASDDKQPLYWVAPMDKNYRRDGPGKSPMGMDLVPVYEEDVSGADDSSIMISPAVENNLGVRTAPVTRESLVMPMTTIGRVKFDESKMSHVHSRVEGWIERLGVAASGDRVSKGQTLYELYSPALVSAQEEYLAALRSGNRNLIKASASRLYALGITAAQVRALEKRKQVEQNMRVVAERDGIIIDLNVRQGMYIKPATEVLSFGALDSVWLEAEVFERHAYRVSEGMPVTAQLSAVPGRTWQGHVNYVYPELNAGSRTLALRIRLPNDDRVLKPNMLMNVSIEREADSPALTVPRTALIKAGNHTRVVKALGEGRYQSVVVEPGHYGVSQQSELGAAQRVEVLSGLQEGDRVVTSAQFLIDSESNVGAELSRLETPPSDTTTTPVPAANRVITTGEVHGVMAQMGMVSMTHAPIPEWEWPTMKMDFPVADHIALDQFKEGETIQFELEKTGDWEYLITAVGDDIGANAGARSTADAGPEMADHKHESDITNNSVRTRGTIKMLMLDMNMIDLVHEPIPEWEWPVMRMTFVVPEGADLPDLEEEDQVEFSLHSLASGDYEMRDIEVVK